MKISENVILAPYTTFKIGGPAQYFCEVKDQQEALEAFEFAQEKKLQTLLLGGGSNLLVSDEGFEGLVVRVVNRGIEVINNNNNNNNDNDNLIMLRVASGEVWDEVVKFAVNNGWWGIENLSHIPGSTGAIAVQNVGAYGQEAKNVIESVTVFNTQTHQILNLNNKDCNFAYRSSIFNTTEKGKYIIFYITFRLQKNGKPNLSYRDLKNYFLSPFTLSASSDSASPPGGEKNNVLSLAKVRQAIIYIRDKKFPFPTEAKKGNAGSFFKNSFLNMGQYELLENTIVTNFGEEKLEDLRTKTFVDLPNFKVPAAFLIELCGLKDLENGGAAINHNQPLVIINKTGQATAKEVLSLASLVRQTVKEKIGISLNLEPELVGFGKDELIE